MRQEIWTGVGLATEAFLEANQRAVKQRMFLRKRKEKIRERKKERGKRKRKIQK